MDKIFFVTSNPGKVVSAQKYFEDKKLVILNRDLVEPRSDDINKIARIKVLQAYKYVKKPCFALDAGFFIEELNGFPRANVNFAIETLGNKGILKLMEGIENRRCYFESVLAYNTGKEIMFFSSRTEGEISPEERGILTKEAWSCLWKIFIPNGQNKTLAELSNMPEQLESWENNKETSAIKKFADYIKKEN